MTIGQHKNVQNLNIYICIYYIYTVYCWSYIQYLSQYLKSNIFYWLLVIFYIYYICIYVYFHVRSKIMQYFIFTYCPFGKINTLNINDLMWIHNTKIFFLQLGLWKMTIYHTDQIKSLAFHNKLCDLICSVTKYIYCKYFYMRAILHTITEMQTATWATASWESCSLERMNVYILQYFMLGL